jgi:hypothetical protein
MSPRPGRSRTRRDDRIDWPAGPLPPQVREPAESFTVTVRRRAVSPEEQRAFDLPAAIEVTDAWLEVELGDGWRAAYRLVPYAGQPVVAEVRIFPADTWPGQTPGAWRADLLGVGAGGAAPLIGPAVDGPAVRHGITARVLRRVRLGEHRRYASTMMSRLRRRQGRDRLTAWGFAGPRTRPVAGEPRGRPDRVYAEIAGAYVARLAAGSRRPVADLARRRKLAESVVRDMIHEARARGMLTAGRQGVPGGQLTAHAEQLLRAPRKEQRR